MLRANPVFDWTELMIDAIRVDNSGPTLSSRNLAILHTSIYDAVNSLERTHQPYRFQLPANADTSLEAAAVGAAHEVIIHLYPGVSARGDQMLQEFQGTNSANAAVTDGLKLGREIAGMALLNRQNDGASVDVPYIPSAEPGMWRRTAPFFRPPIAPHWRYVDFFGLFDVEEYLPKEPPRLDSAEYAASYNEVKLWGAKDSRVRTTDQTEVAHFWSDFSYTSMPPGHWHLIALTIARSKNASLPESARLFALLSMAQADAAVVCWEAKYRYNLWRPITAIQQGEQDGNSATEGDDAWDSLLAAPPFPSYVSGHSTFSKASAAVLASFYGTDQIAFSAQADGLPGVTRSFTSLSQCADEIGMSRIYGGIHFDFDNVAGKLSGAKIGDFIGRNYLLPLDRLPFVSISNFGGTAILNVHGMPQTRVITESSDDLAEWNPISTNSAASGGVQLRHESIGQALFYRARRE